MTLTQAQRKRIAEQANYRCEYCLLHEDFSGRSHEADHIISQKHGGKDEYDNLAWACFICNRYKSSEVGAYDLETSQLVQYFNPRSEIWLEHFELINGEIHGLTPSGRATGRILQFNRPDRITARKILIKKNLYP